MQDFMVAPLPKMRVKVQSIIDDWQVAASISALDMHRMLGTIQYMAPLVPRGWLRIRFHPIQWWAPANPGTRLDHSSIGLVGISGGDAGIVTLRETELTLFTDASTHGWGAQLQDHSISGLWSEAQCQNHINILEMEAVFYAVKGFLNRLYGHVVCLMFDNVTVVLYIKQEGGTRSFRLTRLTIRLLKFCDRKKIVLIPGRNNIQADRVSRLGQTLPTEWEIHLDLLQPVFGH